MALATLTKAQQKELAAELVPLVAQEITADIQEVIAREQSRAEEEARVVVAVPQKLFERMIRTEERIKYLREDFARHIKESDERFKRTDRCFEKDWPLIYAGFALVWALLIIFHFIG